MGIHWFAEHRIILKITEDDKLHFLENSRHFISLSRPWNTGFTESFKSVLQHFSSTGFQNYINSGRP